MGTNDKIEERRRQNMPVLIALDHLRRSKGLNQNEVCALLGVQSSRVSEYKSGKTLAGDDFRGRLIDAFDGRLNIPFLYGESDVLLVENLKPEPAADGADGRVQDLLDRIADLEELVSTQRLLIETLRDRLRSLGVEYVAPSLPTSRTARQYTRPSGTTFSLPAAEQAEQTEAPAPASGASSKPGNASPSGESVSPKTDKP